MLRPARVYHHPMQCTRLKNDLVHCGRNVRFLRYVCMDGIQPVGEVLGDRLEVFGYVAYVKGVDAGCVVVETAFGDSKADASVCTGY